MVVTTCSTVDTANSGDSPAISMKRLARIVREYDFHKESVHFEYFRGSESRSKDEPEAWIKPKKAETLLR